MLCSQTLLVNGEHTEHVAPGIARTQQGRVARPAVRGPDQLNFSQSETMKVFKMICDMVVQFIAEICN